MRDDLILEIVRILPIISQTTNKAEYMNTNENEYMKN